MVRTANQVAEVIAGIEANPGLVLYTLVNDNNMLALEKADLSMRLMLQVYRSACFLCSESCVLSLVFLWSKSMF